MEQIKAFNCSYATKTWKTTAYLFFLDDTHKGQ